MSYDLRLVIEGYVEHCINQKAQESYLAKLNAQLDELESKANKGDEKETPYKPTDLNVNPRGDIVGKCKCGKIVIIDENYCITCGQRLDWTPTEV